MIPPRLLALALILLPIASALALEPADVYLVVNQNVPASRALAEHYCKKRGVPKGHILALDLPSGEDISRRDFDSKLAGPLRELLKDKKDKAKVLLTIYGVPLRVGGAEPTAAEKAELAKLQADLEPLKKRKTDLESAIKTLEEPAKKDAQSDAAKDLAAKRKELNELTPKLGLSEGRRRWLSYAESLAAVDSELALLWHSGFDLRRWQLNL